MYEKSTLHSISWVYVVPFHFPALPLILPCTASQPPVGVVCGLVYSFINGSTEVAKWEQMTPTPIVPRQDPEFQLNWIRTWTWVDGWLNRFKPSSVSAPCQIILLNPSWEKHQYPCNDTNARPTQIKNFQGRGTALLETPPTGKRKQFSQAPSWHFASCTSVGYVDLCSFQSCVAVFLLYSSPRSQPNRLASLLRPQKRCIEPGCTLQSFTGVIVCCHALARFLQCFCRMQLSSVVDCVCGFIISSHVVIVACIQM